MKNPLMQLGFLIQIWIWFLSLNPAPGYNSSPSTNTPRTESKGSNRVCRCIESRFSITAQSNSLNNLSADPFYYLIFGFFLFVSVVLTTQNCYKSPFTRRRYLVSNKSRQYSRSLIAPNTEGIFYFFFPGRFWANSSALS